MSCSMRVYPTDNFGGYVPSCSWKLDTETTWRTCAGDHTVPSGAHTLILSNPKYSMWMGDHFELMDLGDLYHVTPASATIQIPSSGFVNYNVTYVKKILGTLQLASGKTWPTGAMCKINNGEWKTWEQVQSFAPGNNVISFAPVTGYYTPADITIVVNSTDTWVVCPVGYVTLPPQYVISWDTVREGYTPEFWVKRNNAWTQITETQITNTYQVYAGDIIYVNNGVMYMVLGSAGEYWFGEAGPELWDMALEVANDYTYGINLSAERPY